MIATLTRNQSQRTTADWPPLRPTKQVVVNRVLAQFCLGQSLDEPFRLWLMLHALDHNGRGWLSFEDVAATLAHPNSPHFLLDRNALCRVLEEGNGVFWNQGRAKGEVNGELRIFLRGRARIRAALNCDFLYRKDEYPVPTEAIANNELDQWLTAEDVGL